MKVVITVRNVPSPTERPNSLTMDNHFHFNVTPKSGGGYTTRAVPQEDLHTEELVGLLKTALDNRGVELTPDQIDAVGEEFAQVCIAALAKGRPIRRAFNFLTFEATCGGSHTSPDFSPTVENMNVAVRGRLSPDGMVVFEGMISFQRDGVLGDKVPTVTRVYNGTTRTTDTMTLGGAFRLSGPDDFGPEPLAGATTLGVFIIRSGLSVPVHVTSISRWTESEIFGSWPTVLTGSGSVTLSIVVKYPNNTGTSTFIYGTPLPVV